jgi:hypothetical protein
LGVALAGGFSISVGCTGESLNPAFVALLDPSGSSAMIDDAPGYLVISFVNKATVDESLIDYLRREGGLTIPPSVAASVRPRMRLRVQITFVDLSSQTIEFITGSPQLVDARFDASTVTDLNENTLENVTVYCDVATAVVLQGSVEVFIPVELSGYRQTEVTNPQGGTDVTYTLVEQIQPQFRALQVDVVDEDGNVILQQNVGTRDVPGPAVSPLCGSVIGFVVDGVLTVPFLPEAGTDDPSYDVDDEAQRASIGGRYEFRTSVQ